MKKAFTLAETLITITIIGIIAAFMVPAFRNASPDENALQYRKAFYTVEDVVRTLANDASKYDDEELMFKQEPRLTGVDTYQEAFCKYVAGVVNTLGEIKCGNTAVLGDDHNLTEGNVNFKLTNGMAFGGFNRTYANEDRDGLTPKTITVCVDVNGIGNGPDKGCASGDVDVKNRDQFKIRIQHDGKVLTGDDDDGWLQENDILESRRITKKKITY